MHIAGPLVHHAPVDEQPATTTNIVLTKTTLQRPFFVTLGLVITAGVLVEVLGNLSGWSTQSGLLPLFSLSYEGNVPTFYSAVILSSAGCLLALSAIAARKSGAGFVPHWWILALGFFYIAIDEVFSIHELAGGLMSLSGVLYFSWVVPASIVVLVIGLSYLKFLRHLPRRTAIRFLVAGALYVGGAVGMELPLGYWTEKHGTHNLGYALIDAVEESMEMIAVNLFILWLIDHLTELRVVLRFSSETPVEKT